MTDNSQQELPGLDIAGNPDIPRSLLDQLLTDSKVYTTTDSFKLLLDSIIRMRNVAPFNAMLLLLQKPGLTYAASAYDWKERFGRKVKEDARPLLILWPFAPVATVYDILDTYDIQNPDAEGLPEHLTFFFAVGEITASQIRSFKPLLRRKNIELRWVDHGDAKAGRIEVVNQSEDNKSNSYLIKINQNHSSAVQFNTLAHELGHLFLGHLCPDVKLSIPKRRAMKYSEVEIEAESVAYLVCERNKVTTNSEAYLSHFVKAGTSVDSLDLYQITRAAGQVEAILDLTMHTRFPSKAERLTKQ